MADECAHVTETYRQGAYPNPVYKLFAGFRPILEFKGNHPAKASHLPFGEFMLRMAGEPRIAHPFDCGMPFQKSRRLMGVFTVSRKTQRKRRDTVQRQPGVKWTDYATEIPQNPCFCTLDKFCRRRDGARNHGAVPAEVFGHAVKDDIDSKRYRLLSARRCECIVDNCRDAVTPCHLRAGADVNEFQRRIRRTLDVDRPSCFSCIACSIPSASVPSTNVVVIPMRARSSLSRLCVAE